MTYCIHITFWFIPPCFTVRTLSGRMGPVKRNSRKRETARVRKAGCWKWGTQNCAAEWDLIKRVDVWLSYGNSRRTMRLMRRKAYRPASGHTQTRCKATLMKNARSLSSET